MHALHSHFVTICRPEQRYQFPLRTLTCTVKLTVSAIHSLSRSEKIIDRTLRWQVVVDLQNFGVQPILSPASPPVSLRSFAIETIQTIRL